MRWIGLFLVTAGCTGLGTSVYCNIRMRCRRLTEMLRMLYMLKREIIYHKAPLGEAFADMSRQLPAPFSNLCEGISRDLNNNQSELLDTIITNQCQNHLRHTPLKKEDIDRLRQLGQYLGYLDLQMQVQNLELMAEDLEHTIQQQKNEMPKMQKLCLYLGGLGGIFLSILLI